MGEKLCPFWPKTIEAMRCELPPGHDGPHRVGFTVTTCPPDVKVELYEAGGAAQAVPTEDESPSE